MAINLASKYSDKIMTKFRNEAYTLGAASADYDFAGVRSISIYMPKTVELTDYTRSGMARFGAVTEMEDEVQEMTMSQDKAFAISIDRGNNEDQLNIKKAGKMMNLQISEKVTPAIDKYNLAKWGKGAGKVVVLAAAMSKSNIVGYIADAMTALDNAEVPAQGRTLWVGATAYNLIRLSDEFSKVENIYGKAIEKGTMGTIFDATVKRVPDSYLPTGMAFMVTYKDSILAPVKIKTARILTEVAGLDGSLLEGRNYFDAFVKGAKIDGIYVALKNGTAATVAAPTITAAGAITASAGKKFKYTVDGSDPRWSNTAVLAASKAATSSGITEKIRAVVIDDALGYMSAIASSDVTGA